MTRVTSCVFAEGRDAAVAAALLRSEPVSDLLTALMFSDSKRPVTKKLLQRIDLAAVATAVSAPDLAAAASELLTAPVSVEDVESFRVTQLRSGQLELSA